MTEVGERGGSRPRAVTRTSELANFAELFALSGLAIAQPTFDLLGRNTGVLIQSDVNPLNFVGLIAVVLFVPPGIVWGVERVIGAFRPGVRPWAHRLALGLFAGVLCLEIARHQVHFGPALTVIVGIAGGVAMVALVPVDAVRTWLRFLAGAPVVFALLFVFSSPATDVVFAHDHGVVNAPVAKPTRVVMVVLDEFPEESLLDGTGKVDSALFPNFASFAADSTWYRNETTVAPYTDEAVPAILTGRYPHSAQAFPDISDYPDNLFSLLAGTYQMNVHEVVTKLCPDRLCARSAGAGFGHLLQQTQTLWKQFAAPHAAPLTLNVDEDTTQPLRTVQQFTSSLIPTSTPRLDFVHIELPHGPWHLLPTLQDNLASQSLVGLPFLRWTDPYSARVARQRHLLQVQASDALLGTIMTQLKRVDGYENSLVIVTADHGVAFTGGEPLRSVSSGNFSQIMWTPLFVKYPGQTAGVVDDRPAESIDLLPTITDVIGTRAPWPLDGRSLRGPARAEGPRRMYPWGGDAFEPAGALKAPAGRDYLEFPGRSGFAAVLKARAAPTDPEPALRIYRDIEYGDLIGKPSAPLVRGKPGPAFATIKGIEDFDDPQPDATKVPWQFSVGEMSRLPAAAPVAIVRDGLIIGVAHAVMVDKSGNAIFTFIVPPALVTPGGGRPTVMFIRGTRASPTLEPVTMRS